MGALIGRNRIIFFFCLNISILFFFFDSCRLLRFPFPDCSLQEYDYFKPQPQQQQPTAAQLLTNFPGNRLTGPSLASQHSYGFFSDITDESWRLMQQRAWSSLHVKGQALPEIVHSSDHENPTVVASYLNSLQVSLL